MELEALESIFMDDLRVVDATGEEGVGVECRCGAGQEGESMYFITCGSLYIRYEVLAKVAPKFSLLAVRDMQGLSCSHVKKGEGEVV